MKKAFTLIELLVVVLIIGILSAIALPQYTKAVEKAKLAEALTTLGSLRKAIDVAKMEHPGETITKDMLTVNLPAWENENWKYGMYGNFISACRKDSSFSCKDEGKLNTVAIIQSSTGIGLSDAKKCAEGQTSFCPTTCGESVKNLSYIGKYSLIDLGNGTICCGYATSSSVGVSVCKNFNAQ